MKQLICFFTLLFIVLGCEHDDHNAQTRPEETYTNSIGMKLIYIPPGDFMMGSKDGDSDERPIHKVYISRGFYLSTTEVTQAQYKAVTLKLDSTIDGLIQILNEHGITLPKQ